MIGGQRLCPAEIGSPGHSRIASRLSCAGYFAAAGPSANARRTLAVTRRVNAPHDLVIPQSYSGGPNDSTHRIVPALKTPAPLLCV